MSTQEPSCAGTPLARKTTRTQTDSRLRLQSVTFDCSSRRRSSAVNLSLSARSSLRAVRGRLSAGRDSASAHDLLESAGRVKTDRARSDCRSFSARASCGRIAAAASKHTMSQRETPCGGICRLEGSRRGGWADLFSALANDNLIELPHPPCTAQRRGRSGTWSNRIIARDKSDAGYTPGTAQFRRGAAGAGARGKRSSPPRPPFSP